MSKRIRKENIEIYYYKEVYDDFHDEALWQKQRKKVNSFTGIIVFEHTVQYRKNGKLHRENNLPSDVYFDNKKLFFFEGILHRINGPAVTTTVNKNKQYWINGISVSKEQQEFYYDLLKLKNIL